MLLCAVRFANQAEGRKGRASVSKCVLSTLLHMWVNYMPVAVLYHLAHTQGLHSTFYTDTFDLNKNKVGGFLCQRSHSRHGALRSQNNELEPEAVWVQ